jgi:hypothetical protein
MARRPDHRILRHTVIVGPVQVLRPLVHFLGIGLGCHLSVDNRNAVRREHPFKLGTRNIKPGTHNQQIHQIVDIRQLFPVKPRHRYLAMAAGRDDSFPKTGDLRFRRFQALENAPRLFPIIRNALQRVGADADHQPAFNIHSGDLHSRAPQYNNTRKNNIPALH